MSRTLLILIEFALLIALGWYCIRVESNNIEVDLAYRSAAALGYSGLKTVTPQADGQTIILRGRVASPEQKQRAIDSVAGLWGVTEVRDEMVVAPPDNAATNTVADTADTMAAATSSVDTATDAATDTAIETTTDAATNPVIDTAIETAPGATTDTTTNTATEAEEPSATDETLIQQCQHDLRAVTKHVKPRFELGSDTLTSDSAALLREVGAVMKRCPGLVLKITGHTDSIGKAEDNLRLSKARAKRVVEALHELGIDRTRLQAEGAGETRPIANNATAAGREANRRIEFEFVPAAGQENKNENDDHVSTP